MNANETCVTMGNARNPNAGISTTLGTSRAAPRAHATGSMTLHPAPVTKSTAGVVTIKYGKRLQAAFRRPGGGEGASGHQGGTFRAAV